MKNSNPVLPTSQAQFIKDEKLLIDMVGSLKKGSRRLLDTLAYYDNNYQIVFPGQKRLSQNAGLHLRTVKRTINELVEAGLIRKINHPDMKSLIYELNPLLKKQSVREQCKRFITSFLFFPLVFLMSSAPCWASDSGESPLQYVGRRAVYTPSAYEHKVPPYVCKNGDYLKNIINKSKYNTLCNNDIYKTTLRRGSSQRRSRSAYRRREDFEWQKNTAFYKGEDKVQLTKRKVMEERKTLEALKRAFGSRTSQESEKWSRRIASDEQLKANLTKLGLSADFNPFKHETEDESAPASPDRAETSPSTELRTGARPPDLREFSDG